MTAGPRASGRPALGSVGNYAPGDALPLDVRQPPGAGHLGPAASTTQEVNGTGLGAHAEACAFRGTRDQTQNTTPEVKFQGLLSLGRGLPLPDGASCPRCGAGRAVHRPPAASHHQSFGGVWARRCSQSTSTSLYSSMVAWASSTDECPLLPT